MDKKNVKMLPDLFFTFLPLIILISLFVLPLLYQVFRPSSQPAHQGEEEPIAADDDADDNDEPEDNAVAPQADDPHSYSFKKIGKKKAENLACKQEKRNYANFLAQERTWRLEQECKEDEERAREELQMVPELLREREETVRRQKENLEAAAKKKARMDQNQALEAAILKHVTSGDPSSIITIHSVESISQAIPNCRLSVIFRVLESLSNRIFNGRAVGFWLPNSDFAVIPIASPSSSSEIRDVLSFHSSSSI
jgi:hypothetical protein